MSLDISAAFDAVNLKTLVQRLDDEFEITNMSPVDRLLLDGPGVESSRGILRILAS